MESEIFQQLPSQSYQSSVLHISAWWGISASRSSLEWEMAGHPLQWPHNGCDSVPNHQPHHCLLNRSFRCRSLHKWPVTRKMFPVDDVTMWGAAKNRYVNQSWFVVMLSVGSSWTNFCTIWTHMQWFPEYIRPQLQEGYIRPFLEAVMSIKSYSGRFFYRKNGKRDWVLLPAFKRLRPRQKFQTISSAKFCLGFNFFVTNQRSWDWVPRYTLTSFFFLFK